MKKEQIEQLISYIQTDTDLRSIFSDRVFFYIAPTTQTDLHLIINQISNDEWQATTESIIDIKVVQGNDSIAPLTVKEYIDMIRDKFNKNGLSLWTYNTYQITVMWDESITKNVNDRYEGTVRFIFKSVR